jgi:hypothetical protein
MNTNTRVTLLLGAGLLLAAPSPAAAQYFGRNSVQYETFHFKVLKTQHFDVYFYEKEADAAAQAARMAERWYTGYRTYCHGSAPPAADPTGPSRFRADQCARRHG